MPRSLCAAWCVANWPYKIGATARVFTSTSIFGYDRRMVRFLVLSALAVATVISCGGKIVEDGSGGSGAGTTGGAGSSGGSGGTGGGGSPASNAIRCGTASCNLATEECCIDTNAGPGGSGPSGGSSCTPKGKCTGVALACTAAANCSNGQVCCASADPRTPVASCQPSCDGGGTSTSGGPGGPGDPGNDPGDGPNEGPGGDQGGFGDTVQLCATDAECARGRRCQQTPLGFGVCLGRGRGGGGSSGPPPPPPPPRAG